MFLNIYKENIYYSINIIEWIYIVCSFIYLLIYLYQYYIILTLALIYLNDWVSVISLDLIDKLELVRLLLRIRVSIELLVLLETWLLAFTVASILLRAFCNSEMALWSSPWSFNHFALSIWMFGTLYWLAWRIQL